MIFETSTYLPLLEKVLAPYVSAEHKNIDRRFTYGGVDQGWTAYAYEIYPESVAWRTDKLSANDVPKTLEALAASDLAGRVGTTPNIARLATGLVETYGEDGATDLLEKLSALDNKVYNSHSALADALASGEIDVAWDLVASRPIGLKAKGAPVDWRPMEPLYAESNSVGILQSTKSPYTAALFTDFMLSKDAAEANDKWEQGRIYGNTTGQYTMSLGSYPSLKLFPVVDTATLKKWQLVGERLFIRRQ
jgi:ABC-type Fe3+ transport system substrate-binding protein